MKGPWIAMQEDVARGAAWLDRHYPGWEDQVDLTRLAVDSDRDCVLGQVTGSWAREMRRRFFMPVVHSDAAGIVMTLLYPPAWFAFVWNYHRGFIDGPGWWTAWNNEIVLRRHRDQYKVKKLADAREPVLEDQPA